MHHICMRRSSEEQVGMGRGGDMGVGLEVRKRIKESFIVSRSSQSIRQYTMTWCLYSFRMPKRILARFWLCDRLSLYSSGWHQTCCVPEDYLELQSSCLYFLILCDTMPGSAKHFEDLLVPLCRCIVLSFFLTDKFSFELLRPILLSSSLH